MNEYIRSSVAYALAEDVGDGDLTAGLIASSAQINATIISRDAMTMAGQAWVNEVMRQVDASIEIDWQHVDGDAVAAGSTLCLLRGPARGILTAERTALNFLQFLSSTATTTARYVATVAARAAGFSIRARPYRVSAWRKSTRFAAAVASTIALVCTTQS